MYRGLVASEAMQGLHPVFVAGPPVPPPGSQSFSRAPGSRMSGSRGLRLDARDSVAPEKLCSKTHRIETLVVNGDGVLGVGGGGGGGCWGQARLNCWSVSEKGAP